MGALDYLNLGTRRPLRVAAYCRESTGQAQQKESYDNQEAFFTRAIREHEGWECAGIYGDRARTGRYFMILSSTLTAEVWRRQSRSSRL